MQSIKISCTITTLEDFHIGTGTGNIGLYDDGQFKDGDGIPTLNASTMKGLLRDSCKALDRAKQRLSLPEQTGLFSKLFESFENLSSLDIEVTPKPIPDSQHEHTLIHYFTAVDHANRKAKRGSLRSLEFGAKGMVFELQLRYLNRSGNSEQICQYLLEGLKNIKSIGGHRRRGFGAIAVVCGEPHIEDVLAAETPKASGTRLEIILELNEDTILSSKAQYGNLLSTNDYIPGTTILGMLRSILLAQNSQSTYLDDDKVSASFFYPMPKDNCAFGIDVCPALLSFRKKKTYLNAHSFEKSNHLATLPPWVLDVASGEKFSDMLSHNTLNDENEHKDQSKGVYEGYLYRKDSDQSWKEAQLYKASKLYHQRNSIDSAKQSTASSGIFIEEKLKRGTCFLGSLSFASSADCIAFIQDFYSWLKHENPLHVGRGGKAMYVKAYQNVPAPDRPNISLKEGKGFSVSLLSDAILYNEQLNPSTILSPEILASILGSSFPSKDFKLLNFVSRSGVVSAFSGTSGLRKFRDHAIRKGSCFSFEYSGTNITGLQTRLHELEQDGIGLRRHEGFGSIAINHPLHDLASTTQSNLPEPTLSPADISNSEVLRLNQKAKMYNDAKRLTKEISAIIKGKFWTSMAADALMYIEEGNSLTKLKERFRVKKMDNSKTGAWAENDSRYKIAQILMEQIDKETPAETIATALKLLLDGKGDMK